MSLTNKVSKYYRAEAFSMTWLIWILSIRFIGRLNIADGRRTAAILLNTAGWVLVIRGLTSFCF